MTRQALIVGINRYTSLNRLRLPALDADAIARLLEQHGEFKITRLPEVIASDHTLAVGGEVAVTAEALEAAIIQLFKPDGPEHPDTALLFFAGHGLQRKRGVTEGYLATTDADLKTNWGVSLNWLRELLQESPVQNQIVWLDACHSGELFNYRDYEPTASRNRCFIAAARSFEVAYEDTTGSHGILTKALLEALNPTQTQADVDNHGLVAHIAARLKKETQSPVCNNAGEPIILTFRRQIDQPLDIGETLLIELHAKQARTYSKILFNHILRSFCRSLLDSETSFLGYASRIIERVKVLDECKAINLKKNALSLEPPRISGRNNLRHPTEDELIKHHYIEAVKTIRSALTRSIAVSCSTSVPSIIGVIKSLASRYELTISIDFSDRNSRFQVGRISMALYDEIDFLVCADAPYMLVGSNKASSYIRLFPIYLAEQFLIKKKSLAPPRYDKIHVVWGTSGHEYLLLEQPRINSDSILPFETDIYRYLLNIMEPGNKMLAWDPIASEAKRLPEFLVSEESAFDSSISIYCHDQWTEPPLIKSRQAFIDLFIAEWNYYKQHPEKLLDILCEDKEFLMAYAQSGGVIPSI